MFLFVYSRTAIFVQVAHLATYTASLQVMPQMTQSEKDLQDFKRNATNEDIAEYNNIRGRDAKKYFREQIKSARLLNVSGVQQTSNTETKKDVTVSWYKNWPMLIKGQGGQIDMPFALKAAENIARKCQQRGPPWVLFNPDSECLEYLDSKKGSQDCFTRSRSRSESGEYEVELTDKGMEVVNSMAARSGLSTNIPSHLIGNVLGDSLSEASTAPGTPSALTSDEPMTPSSTPLKGGWRACSQTQPDTIASQLERAAMAAAAVTPVRETGPEQLWTGSVVLKKAPVLEYQELGNEKAIVRTERGTEPGPETLELGNVKAIVKTELGTKPVAENQELGNSRAILKTELGIGGVADKQTLGPGPLSGGSEIGIAALVKTEAPTGLRKRRPTGDSETAGTKKTKTQLKNMFAESCAKVKKIKGMRDQASTMIREKKAEAQVWKWMSEVECDEVEKTIKNCEEFVHKLENKLLFNSCANFLKEMGDETAAMSWLVKETSALDMQIESLTMVILPLMNMFHTRVATMAAMK